MILFKNVDLIDLPAILEKGILPISKTGNNNWEQGRRGKNSEDIVYLFSPIEGKINTFIQYGIVLLEVEVEDAVFSPFADNDVNKNSYIEYTVPFVKTSEIKKIYIPKIFKDFPCIETIDFQKPFMVIENLDTEIQEKINFVDITAQIYKENGYVDVTKEELINFARTCGNFENSNSNGFYGYMKGYNLIEKPYWEKPKKEVITLSNVNFIII